MLAFPSLLAPSWLPAQHTEMLCSAQWQEATSAGNSIGCQVTFKAVWSRAAHSLGQRPPLWLFSSLEEGRLGTSATRAQGDTKHLGSVSPNSCSYSNPPLPLHLFSEHSLYYFQIHIWKRLPQAKSNFSVAFWLQSATEEILQTQASNLRSLLGMSQRMENLT